MRTMLTPWRLSPRPQAVGVFGALDALTTLVALFGVILPFPPDLHGVLLLSMILFLTPPIAPAPLRTDISRPATF